MRLNDVFLQFLATMELYGTEEDDVSGFNKHIHLLVATFSAVWLCTWDVLTFKK